MPEFSPELIDQLIDAIALRQGERTALKRLKMAYHEARLTITAPQAEAAIASIEREFEARFSTQRSNRYFKAVAEAHRDLSPRELAEIYQSCSASEEPQ